MDRQLNNLCLDTRLSQHLVGHIQNEGHFELAVLDNVGQCFVGQEDRAQSSILQEEGLMTDVWWGGRKENEDEKQTRSDPQQLVTHNKW